MQYHTQKDGIRPRCLPRRAVALHAGEFKPSFTRYNLVQMRISRCVPRLSGGNSVKTLNHCLLAFQAVANYDYAYYLPPLVLPRHSIDNEITNEIVKI
jgi:hypothetical protein